jgi:tetratricopeptide (TPR) repeat protein
VRARDPAAEVLARCQVGLLSGWLGRIDEARDEFARAGERLSEVTAPVVHARYETFHGAMYVLTSELDRAEASYARAAEIYAGLGAVEEGMSRVFLGNRLLWRGALEAARGQFERALPLLARVGDMRGEGYVEGYLGLIDQEEGDFGGAERRFARSRKIHGEIGYRRFQAVVDGLRGNLELERGDAPAALLRYRAALTVLNDRDTVVTRDRAMNLVGQGCALARIGGGELAAAERSFTEGERLLASAGMEGDVDVCRLHRGHLDIARAESSGGADTSEVVARLRRLVGEIARAGGADPLRRPSDDVRFAMRVLEKALARFDSGARARPAQRVDVLRIAGDGRWFQLGARAREDLQRNGPQRLVLLRLARERAEHPGRALSQGELVGVGWPGDRARADSASARLYKTIQRLRDRGLDPHLVTRDDGYLLDGVSIAWSWTQPM